MNEDTSIINLSCNGESAKATIVSLDQCVVTIENEHGDRRSESMFNNRLEPATQMPRLSKGLKATESGKSHRPTAEAPPRPKSLETAYSFTDPDHTAKGPPHPNCLETTGSFISPELAAEGTTFLERVEAADSSSNAESPFQVPPLEEGKDKYFFISHSTEDFHEVLEIVTQLEQRFKLSCIIADRDFQSGKGIFENIEDSLRRSSKTIFMLTPNFVSSRFCMLELDNVFKISIDCGINNYIPVLLEECDIPTPLATVTYIDGTLPGVDIPAKIVQELTQPELGEENVGEYTVTRKFENGYCYSIMSEPRSCCRLLPATYTFSFSDKDASRLQQARIRIPAEVITDTMNLLNKNNFIQPREYKSLCQRGLGLVALVEFFVLFPSFLLFSIGGYSEGAYSLLAAIILAGIGGIIMCALLCRKLCPSYQEDCAVQDQIWTLAGQKGIQNNSFIIFEIRDSRFYTPPTIHFMRYNIVECKMYLVRLIQSREKGHTDETSSPEERADRQIERAMERLLRRLTPSLSVLPDAPYNRHNVRMSKMCLCQLIEAGSPLVN